MIFKRNSVTVTILIVCVLLLCFFTSNRKTAFTASAEITEIPQIILDAGHGGLTNTIKV